MNKKVCCIFNVGPYYRFPIYNKMSVKFNVDFYIGDKGSTPIKLFNYYDLNGFKRKLPRINLFGNWYWLSGVLGLAFKPYDIYIITGEPFCLSVWIFLVFAKLIGKDTVAWTHGWYGKESGVRKVVKKCFFNLFTKIMCYNEYSTKLMIEQGFSVEKVVALGNSLDTDMQRKIRTRLHVTDIFSKYFGNDAPVILYCGRIQKVKKLDLLVKMLAMMKHRGIEANLVFVGKDVDNVGILDIAKNLGLTGNIWFYGPCYDEEKLGEIFYNSSVCVSPGNVGLTAIHSLSYGCPVITHNDFANQMPEFEAIIPGVTGDFFKYGDVDDMLRCTLKWLNRSVDERECTRIAAFNEIDRKWNIYSQIGIMNSFLFK